MNKTQFLVVTILFCIFFVINSCTHREKSVILKESDKQEVTKIIPPNKYGGNYFPYKLVQKTIKSTKLNLLDKGYDSIFIRLWYVYRFNFQVIDLKKSNGKWSAEIHYIELGNVNDKLEVIKTNSINITPKSDWNIFIGKLFSLNILTLPDDSELPDYGFGTDGAFVTVEIATRSKYRIYSYSEPIMHLKIPEAANMENIMILIEQELGVKRDEKF